MPYQKICQYSPCSQHFIGRANQEYCSNAHKTKAFRLREEEDRQRMISLKEPILLLKYTPSAYHQRKYPQHCKELNWIHSVYRISRDFAHRQGTYTYKELKEEFKDDINLYLNVSREIVERIKNGEYSKKFTFILGKELNNYPRFYRNVVAILRKVLKNFTIEQRKGEVDVLFDEKCLQKMQKTAELYHKFWLTYKQSYL